MVDVHRVAGESWQQPAEHAGPAPAVGNLVQDRLAQVGGRHPEFDEVVTVQGGDQRVLHEVVGIHVEVAHHGGEPPQRRIQRREQR